MKLCPTLGNRAALNYLGIRKSFTMLKTLLSSIILSSMFACYTWAAPTYYADRSAFDLANPGLSFEDFESVILTDSEIFSELSLPGLTLDGTPGGTNSDILVVGPTAGLDPVITSYVAVANQNFDALMLTFDGPGATAAGMDLISLLVPSTFTISLFDDTDTLIDSGSWSIASSTATFWGFSNSSAIKTAIFESGSIDAFETIDNISFGLVPIPAAVWLFSSGLLGLIGIARRKKAA